MEVVLNKRLFTINGKRNLSGDWNTPFIPYGLESHWLPFLNVSRPQQRLAVSQKLLDYNKHLPQCIMHLFIFSYRACEKRGFNYVKTLLKYSTLKACRGYFEMLSLIGDCINCMLPLWNKANLVYGWLLKSPNCLLGRDLIYLPGNKWWLMTFFDWQISIGETPLLLQVNVVVCFLWTFYSACTVYAVKNENVIEVSIEERQNHCWVLLAVNQRSVRSLPVFVLPFISQAVRNEGFGQSKRLFRWA